jgi:hypothetical protein
MKFDRKLVIAIVVAIVIGFWAGGGTWQKSPWLPIPLPTPGQPNDRPILQILKKAARWALWAAVLAEPPPAQQPDHRLVQAPAIGEDGYPIVDHARGW